MQDFVRARMEEILSRFCGDASARVPEAPLTQQQVENVHRLLLALAQANLWGPATRGAATSSDDPQWDSGQTVTIRTCADSHARSRLKQQVPLGDVIAELMSLQRIVVGMWLEDETADEVSKSDFMSFVARMDDAIRQCIVAYNERVARLRELFLGALGHDLRTPLATILTGSEYLLKSEQLEGEALKLAVRLRNSAQRMQGMLDDLVDFTRTRLGNQLPLKVARVNLADLVAQVVSEISISSPGRSVEVDAMQEMWGDWDEARLHRLLSNLLSNALQYGDPASPVELRARPSGDGSAAELSVRNQGEPIPAELLANIFDPLVRGTISSDERRMRDKGMGLGLYICRQVAKAHGGVIAVSSGDSGTEFVVRLPVPAHGTKDVA